ncbi:MAG: YerC/YecD family TrpR-related protein, partial [Candidatus Spechtbacterales bacterium]
MAKFRHPSPLSPEVQEEILQAFADVLAEIQSPSEALAFIKDLLSTQEAEMLAKRIQIAQMLLKGHRYDTIQSTFRVSANTIARINEWLKRSGDGYRRAIEKLEKKQPKLKKLPIRMRGGGLSDLRRQHPVMFWPQAVLEEIVRMADEKKKKQLR